MAELRLLFFCVDPERIEHFRLQLRLVDSNAATADLDPVQHHIVSLGPHLIEFLLSQQRQVLRFRPREWMMDRVPFVFLCTPLHQRKIRHPEEIEPLRTRGQLLNFGNAQSNSAEHFAGDLPFIGRE